MKKCPRILILLMIGLFGARLSPAMAAEPSPYADRLTVGLSAEPGILYSNQIFRLTMLIHSQGIPIDPSISYDNFFEDGRILRTTDFKEMLPERKMRDNQLWETRRFVCSARAVAIGPIQLAPTVTLTVYERRASFFGPARVERPVTVAAAPLTLTIHPIPLAGRPPSYSGAIGTLAFNVDVAPLDVAVNDLIKVRMRISGTAHMPDVQPPPLLPGPNFKVYAPTPIPGLPSNTIAFEQTVVPLNTRATEIPAVSFSYFDPIQSIYKTTTLGPFPLKFHARVAPVDDGSSKPSVTILTKETSAGAGSAAAASDRWVARLNRLLLAVEDGTFLQPEATVPAPVRARLAPAPTALGLFDIPAGARVFVIQRQPEWIKIAFNRNRGWIPASSIPATPPD